MITHLTDENYKDILNNHFSKSEIVICGISPNLQSCDECKATMESAETFFSQNPNSNIRFCFVDYVKYDILQNYYQLQELSMFPKIIVFYGNWDDKEFMEGRISVEKFEEISKKLPEKT